MKLKSLILTFALTLFAVSGLLAQDKSLEQYQYAFVTLQGYKIAVCTSGGVETFKPGGTGADINVEVIKKVEEMTQQGWEVYNSTSSSSGGGANVIVAFTLRKKKN